MTPEDFDFVSRLVKERSGLTLTDDKAYLVENRLMPVVRQHEHRSLADLIKAIRTSRDEGLIGDVTEAMTTNESFFFRDGKPFDILRDQVLPSLLESRADKKAFRIWCAAASTGQEPYSIAMVLKEEAARLSGWRHEIIGTDISTRVLTRAQRGAYSQFEVQRGLPIQLLIKYFKQDKDYYVIDQSLRSMVRYQHFNLLHDLKPLGSFDVIFCRNVLIYFDAQTKERVLEKMAALMPPDGLLFLGGAETVVGITERFKPVAGQRGLYALNAAPAAQPAQPKTTLGSQVAKPGKPARMTSAVS